MSMPITAAPVHVLMCNHNYTDFKATDSDKYRVPEIRNLRFFVVILDIYSLPSPNDSILTLTYESNEQRI